MQHKFIFKQFFGQFHDIKYPYLLLLWGHILPYPKDGLVQPKHILRA